MKSDQKKLELKPCKCGLFSPFVFETKFLIFPIHHTIVCCHCGANVHGRTFQKAVNKWNRRVDSENRNTKPKTLMEIIPRKALNRSEPKSVGTIEWTRIEKCKPNTGTRCLGFTGSGTELAVYKGGETWLTDYHGHVITGKALFTHWMSLDEWRRSNPEWRIKKRKPEIGTRCLCFTGSVAEIAVYEGGERWREDHYAYSVTRKKPFTHWMRLPEPPKEQEIITACGKDE